MRIELAAQRLQASLAQSGFQFRRFELFFPQILRMPYRVPRQSDRAENDRVGATVPFDRRYKARKESGGGLWLHGNQPFHQGPRKNDSFIDKRLQQRSSKYSQQKPSHIS